MWKLVMISLVVSSGLFGLNIPEAVRAFNSRYKTAFNGPIVFVDKLEGLTVGQANEDGSIDILRPYWVLLSEDAKEELLYHELGHAALALEHNDSVDSFGCPVSIMNSNVFERCFTARKEEYKEQLKLEKPQTEDMFSLLFR